jgi:DNA repair photolyase
MSITSVPVRQFEPGVPPLQRRVETLRKLGSAGIPTYVSLAPVIPGLMMIDLEKLFGDLSDAGVSQVSFGVLRFNGYDESRRLFEETAGLSTMEALEGQDELVARLSELVRKYGMHPRNRMGWMPDNHSDETQGTRQISFDSLSLNSIE